MALPLRVDDLPSFADEELYAPEEVSASEEEDPYLKRRWSAFLAGVRVVMREAEAGRVDRQLLTTDMDALLFRIFMQELKSLEEYAGIAKDLRDQEFPPEKRAEFWRAGAETLGALQNARKELVRMRAEADVFTNPPVVEYTEEGGVSVDPNGMDVAKPYIFDFGGYSHVALKMEDGSVDFHVLPAPFEGDPNA